MSNILIGLNSVAITCAAGLLMGTAPSYYALVSAFLIIYAVYSYDRAKGGAEDAGKKKSGNKKLAAIAALASILIYPHAIVLLPAVAGLLYTARLPAIGRPKDLPGAKSIIVSTSIAGLAVGLVLWDLRVFAFLFISVFVNSVICDIRDIEGDGLHGVRTIPVMLGVECTKLVLVIITSAMWFLLPVSGKSIIAILASYALIVLPYQEWMVDGDWIMITGIYMVISQVLHI
jgi:4-hydroxybenzoate polyprenyltransferase